MNRTGDHTQYSAVGAKKNSPAEAGLQSCKTVQL